MPVMFFIHGGNFINGSNSDDFYGPDYLMRENVVLVVVNYRLGFLGKKKKFLSFKNNKKKYK